MRERIRKNKNARRVKRVPNVAKRRAGCRPGSDHLIRGKDGGIHTVTIMPHPLRQILYSLYRSE